MHIQSPVPNRFSISNKKTTYTAPDVQEVSLTIFPDANTNAVVFGSLIRMMTAAKRCLQ
jgi:hypothetical protein